MTGLFADRHIGTDRAAQTSMLEVLGYASVDALMDAAIPSGIRVAPGAPTALPPAASEVEALAELRALAARNRVARPMIGLGYYGTHTPAVIQRNVLENPSWYTAYTPYQPEISQGRLEALINFQTMVTDLTGLATANASMLDEGTAVVEGMLLARRASGADSRVFLVDTDLLPRTRALLAHRAEAVGIELLDTDFSGLGSDGELPAAFGAAIQYPGASGRVWNPADAIARVQAGGGLAVVAADLLALALISSPGELGADVAVGTTQRFGVPLGFGGPHAGYMAVRAGLERQLPGRLVGVSQDASGYPAYRLSLQTREQHIRREKATSNICTAQVLLAVMASMYAVYHGPRGIRSIAHHSNRMANLIVDALRAGGIEPVHAEFFDTVRIAVPARAAQIVAAADTDGVLLWPVDGDHVQFSTDETTTASDALAVLRAVLGDAAPTELGFKPLTRSIGQENMRQTEYLTHPVFQTHHSETGMMRYLKYLADKDYALDRGMIPLGSCT
ncbi:MAG TPA: glycine dehydrogenase (aminomethyl-transferring), partial [Protaetiibacter sp.]|nr:glycine dehydrogenase (aminomethyl-transferring) [Protaetiibacter sp.]